MVSPEVLGKVVKEQHLIEKMTLRKALRAVREQTLSGGRAVEGKGRSEAAASLECSRPGHEASVAGAEGVRGEASMVTL